MRVRPLWSIVGTLLLGLHGYRPRKACLSGLSDGVSLKGSAGVASGSSDL